MYVPAPRNPESGLCSSSRTMRGIAKNTGTHFQGFHSLLIRMPIRKTTKSPSIAAVTRLRITWAIAMSSSFVEGHYPRVGSARECDT